MPELSETILAARNTVMERENARDPSHVAHPGHVVDGLITLYQANRIPQWPGLFKLQEELHELGVVLAKLSAFPDGDYPDEKRDNLVVDLIEEASDVQAALDAFRARNHIPLSYQRMARKKVRYDEWALTGEGE